jgi:hypothetical protein
VQVNREKFSKIEKTLRFGQTDTGVKALAKLAASKPAASTLRKKPKGSREGPSQSGSGLDVLSPCPKQ